MQKNVLLSKKIGFYKIRHDTEVLFLEVKKFKKSLFGFKRRDVINYIAETEAEFHASLNDYSDRLDRQLEEYTLLTEKHNSAVNELNFANRKNADLNAVVNEKTDEIEHLKASNAAIAKELDSLSEKTAELKSAYAGQETQLNLVRSQLAAADTDNKALKEQVSLLRQKASLDEKAHLNSRRLLTEYLDTLHHENIELSQKCAELESKLGSKKATAGSQAASAADILESIASVIEKITREKNDVGRRENDRSDETEQKTENKLKIL